MKYKRYIRYMLYILCKNVDLPNVFKCFFDKNGRFGKYSNKPSRLAGDGDVAYVFLMISVEIIQHTKQNHHFCCWTASWAS